MTEQSNPGSNQKNFDEAPGDAWFRCLSSTCHSAYQKKECDTDGVCPYCKGTAYNAEPWDSALLNNPQFPRVPRSGQKYGDTIIA